MERGGNEGREERGRGRKAERGGEEVMETAHWYASLLHTYTYLHLVPSLIQKHHFRVSPPNVLNIHIRAGRGWGQGKLQNAVSTGASHAPDKTRYHCDYQPHTQYILCRPHSTPNKLLTMVLLYTTMLKHTSQQSDLLLTRFLCSPSYTIVHVHSYQESMYLKIKKESKNSNLDLGMVAT